MAINLTETDNAIDATNAEIYTFSAQAIGVASADRIVIVGISTRAGATSIDSVTIGGISASEVVFSGHGTGSGIVTLYQAAVPTETTADIVVNLNVTANRCGIVVWRLTGANATATATASDNSITSDAFSASLVIPADGV